MMNKKYISSETKKQLKVLKDYKSKVSAYTPEQAKQALIKTGIYQKNGQLKPCYK